MMHRLSILLLFLVFFAPMFTAAQTPLGINYQGIARSGDGSPLINQNIGLRMSITAGPNGSIDYIEEHHIATNDFGLFTVIVGNGQSGGSLNNVDWIAGNKWLQIEIDPQDQDNYMLVGSQQLLSVPYALFAAQSGNGLSPGVGIDISNGKVNNALPDQIITLEGEGAATVTGTYPNFRINTTDNVEDADASSTNEIQALTLNGTNLELSNGGTVDLSGFVNTDGQNLADVLTQGTDANGAIISGLADPLTEQDAATKNYVDSQNALDLDKDTTNEIQDLQLTANTLSITNNASATSIDLSGYLNTDSQNLSNVLGVGSDAGTSIISNLGNPTDPQDAATKGYVDGQIALDGDQDSSNEIQDLQLAANTLSITNNGSATPIDLSGYVNTDSQNLSNVLGVSNDAGNTKIANLAPPTLVDDAATKGYVDGQIALDGDQDSSNEIQDLQLAANTLSITNNGSATPIDLSGYVNTDSQNLSSVLGVGNDAGNTKIANLAPPTLVDDAATKGYVDSQSTILSTNISANTTAINTETTSRTTADGVLQGELDATQAGAGLNTNGSYTPPSSSNFLGTALSLNDADSKLDAEINNNASTITSLTSRLDNTYAFSADFTTNTSGATNKATVNLVESLDNFNQVSSTEIVIGATGLYMIVIDAERSNFDPLFNSLYLSINGSETNVPLFANGFNVGKTVIRYLNSGDTVRLLVTTAGAITLPFDGAIGGYKISD